MKQVCKFYQRGECKFGKRCYFLHVDKADITKAPQTRPQTSKLSPTTVSTSPVQLSNENCKKFLENTCDNQKCPLIHNYSLKFQKEINSEFIDQYNSMADDFSVLEPYERKIFSNVSLDVMFIMDCTGSMQSWINEAKAQLNNIISYIIENNPFSQVRMSFVGYRDFTESSKTGMKGQYVYMDFTEDIDSLRNFISQVEADGGGDEPEDIPGGLLKVLSMNWKSVARYAVLVCDAPCHGKKYSNVSYDTYPEGDPNGNDIESLIVRLAENKIKLYLVEINDSTKKMFNIMSQAYKSVTNRDLHVEKLGLSSDRFGFFVALSASVTLGSTTYNQMSLNTMFLGFQAEAIKLLEEKYGKLNDIDMQESGDQVQKVLQMFEKVQLDENEKKILSFISRMNKLTFSSALPENDIDMETNCEKCKMKYRYDDNNLPSNPKPPGDWEDVASSSYDCICYTWFICKDRNVNIDWRNPLIQRSQITSKVKISSSPFARGAMRYAFYLYDSYLDQKMVGKLPAEVVTNDYTVDNLGRDIESVIICQGIANEFNERILNFLPNSDLIINFVHCFVYEITSKKYKNPFKYFSVENYINGRYEKYNNNTGWINEDLTESSLIAHAFSHFSWQITKGYLMIVDLQGVGSILTDPQIHCLNPKKFGHGNLGYYGILRFFLSHFCNEYCKKLELVHPRSKVKLSPKDFSFFVEKYELPKDKDESVFKLCDLCRKPFKELAATLFTKKLRCLESYCPHCNEQRILSEKTGVCIDCNTVFKSSEYWFKMKRTDFPIRCSPCRLNNRNKMRAEKAKEGDK